MISECLRKVHELCEALSMVLECSELFPLVLSYFKTF